ncbi:putative VPS74-protein [Tilletiaria anomala UBC 951]|uniref:Putative VPS74-protein n=1 Tax=Tilletiaria anomala (strain ATCC 24038 / CBS 436.72 / UBC 951) TaxID=1037660 RepID=A0A066VVI1_TILAU|nr:putative VPS74-protein [Tilletiaria anomala UBC 951]KDN45732.1 putative VPS74-protein [Tilletiaria anomala UBC 951]
MSASGTGGLQRRRVPGSSAAPSTSWAAGAVADLDEDTPPRSHTSTPVHQENGGESRSSWDVGSSSRTRRRDGDLGNPNSPGIASFSRSGGGGQSITVTDDRGRRVAYDPRDLNDDKETNEHPHLTLMEEILLLGLKDRAGYLSFWNDNISYALRGCILLELVLRKRIAVTKDPSRRRFAVQDRILEVIGSKMTGEVLLDEALKVMKACDEPMSCSQWVDLLSGETWNWMKIGFQMKQVRERLAKGLVDKGILRTEKRNFLLFDMATHPVADTATKDAVLKRILVLLTSSSSSVHANIFYREEKADVTFRVTRALCLLCCAFAANVLENALTHLTYEARETAFQKADDIMNEFSQWPMAPQTPGGGIGAAPTAASASGARMNGTGIGEGSVLTDTYEEASMGVGVTELARAIRNDYSKADESQYEAIAGLLATLAKMDSLI